MAPSPARMNTCALKYFILTTESRWSVLKFPRPVQWVIALVAESGCVFLAQLLREDFHGAQRMGAHGAAQPGRHLDCQLFQRPDGACVGGSDKGMQSWAPRARACGRVHFLGSRELLLHHIRSYRIRGNVPALLHEHTRGHLCALGGVDSHWALGSKGLAGTAGVWVLLSECLGVQLSPHLGFTRIHLLCLSVGLTFALVKVSSSVRGGVRVGRLSCIAAKKCVKQLL